MTADELNEALLASLGYPPGSEEYQYALSRMRIYRDHRWWLSEDACERAYFRTEEWYATSVLLLQTREQYRADLAVLTGRILPDEFIENREHLLAAIRVAFAHYLKAHGRLAEREAVCRAWPSEEAQLVLMTEAAFAERGMIFPFEGGEWAVADVLDPLHRAQEQLQATSAPDVPHFRDWLN
jgi:hypothetical protein